ncbi:MAG: SusC/RagA family TonB-linked outer membrane protein [Prevotella sp.]|nr:SusC/RagA family TonB-linked outer membrane protein [Prevotella sp.]
MVKIKHLFLLLMLLVFSGGAFGQGKRVTVDFKNVEATTALRQIEKQSGMKMQYSIRDMNFRVTYNARNAEPVKVVKDIVGKHGFTVSTEGKYIMIHRQTGDATQLSGHTRSISGYVYDEAGEPLAGVPISIGGSKTLSVTDVKGHYTCSIPVEAISLKFSYVGLSTEYVRIAQGNTDVNKDVVLRSDNQLGEVLIVDNGFYTRKAESFTGSATVYNKDELRLVGNTNVLNSLKNLDPSFHFAENLAVGSDPNSLPDITLRGQSGFPDLKGEYQTNPNQPLFIVDGFETSLTKVIDMDMNRIENVTILKDAAAKAIYGSKAANGVVIIETVKPKSGKLNVTYTGQLTFSFPDFSSYNLTNAAEKLQVEKNAGLFTYEGDNGSSTWTNVVMQGIYDDYYNSLLSNVLRGYDTDWKAQPVHNTVGHKHTMYIEGGNKEFQYGIDFSYNNVEGVMKGSDRNTFAGGLTFSYHFKKLLLRDNLEVTYNKANNSPWGTFNQYTSMNPYYRPYDDDGNLIKAYSYNQKGVFLTEGTVINPMWNATIRTKDFSDYTQMNNNFYAEYRFTDAFKMVGRLGIMWQNSNAEIFHPASHTDFVDYTSDELMKRRGRYTYSDGKAHRITADVSANYSKTFAEKHLLFFNLGWSMEDYEYNTARFVAEGFPNDQLADIGYARSYLKDSSPSTFENKTRDAGAIGALNYSYDNRYLFDASFRLSGSSQFGSNNRWGKFWSLGMGWNVHKEKFMEAATWLNQLKLRASMGFTGSQNFNSYQSMSTWNYYSSRFYDGRPTSYLLSMANENLKWQRKYDQNVGFDFTAFNHRLNMRFDYYIATTDDLLTDVTIPSSTGFTSYKENLGKVENKGAELYASYRVYQSANHRDYVNLYANVTHNKNRIKEISNSLRTYNSQQTNAVNNRPITRYEEGQSMTAIWAVPSQGIDPTTGKDILVKQDGSTTFVWNSDDLAICGDTESDIYGNCGISAYYKGFTFALGMNYQFGGQLYNQTLVDKVENADLTKNVDRRVFSDRWTNTGDISQFKNIKDQSTTRSTSRFVEDNNVWAFSSLNISYDFDHLNPIKQLGFNRLRLAFDMSDVARISSIKTERGTSYPYAKSFSFSIQAMF